MNRAETYDEQWRIEAHALLTRIHAAMIRCRWNEPTGMDEGKDSALNLEREVREWLGK
jgi:phenolic acid decarboxylase